MSTFGDILFITTNYSHDIATAVLGVSGISMWLLSRQFPRVKKTKETSFFFISTYHVLRKAVEYSLLWIVLAGVPRIIFYGKYDWVDMAGQLQVLAVAVKHVVMFVLVGIGLFFWIQMHGKIKSLETTYTEQEERCSGLS